MAIIVLLASGEIYCHNHNRESCHKNSLDCHSDCKDDHHRYGCRYDRNKLLVTVSNNLDLGKIPAGSSKIIPAPFNYILFSISSTSSKEVSIRIIKNNGTANLVSLETVWKMGCNTGFEYPFCENPTNIDNLRKWYVTVRVTKVSTTNAAFGQYEFPQTIIVEYTEL